MSHNQPTFIEAKDLVEGKFYNVIKFNSIPHNSLVYIVKLFKSNNQATVLKDYENIITRDEETEYLRSHPKLIHGSLDKVLYIRCSTLEHVVTFPQYQGSGFSALKRMDEVKLMEFIYRLQFYDGARKAADARIKKGFPSILDSFAKFIPDTKAKKAWVDSVKNDERLSKLVTKLDEIVDE
jgi:hypothetical protein